MQVLVDTSIWIDYFKSGTNSNDLSFLIDENLVVTNDIKKFPLQIDWEEIIQFQVKCLKSGISGIGIPDLIIAQNSKQNNSNIFSLDNHFTVLEKIIGINIYK